MLPENLILYKNLAVSEEQLPESVFIPKPVAANHLSTFSSQISKSGFIHTILEVFSLTFPKFLILFQD